MFIVLCLICLFFNIYKNKPPDVPAVKSVCPSSMHSQLTQLIEVGVTAISSWHWADEAGLEKRGPLVDQTALAPHVILGQDTNDIRVKQGKSGLLTTLFKKPKWPL